MIRPFSSRSALKLAVCLFPIGCALRGAPDCCAAAAARAPLSERSVYQVGGAWTSDAGAAVDLAAWRGHPVVLAMIFTRCASACPATVAEMKALSAALPPALREDTRFVLASFDPQGDPPAVLRSYRNRMGLPEDWILLSGGAAAVRDLAMVLGVSYERLPGGLFRHSSLVTVLNGQGEIVWQRANLSGAMEQAVQNVAAAR